MPSIRRQMQSRARPPQLTHSRSGRGNSANGIADPFDTHLDADDAHEVDADKLCARKSDGTDATTTRPS